MGSRYVALLSLPLAAAGLLFGHAAGYWVAVPHAHERAQVLHQTGHGYLAYAPVFLGACLVLVLLAAAIHVGQAAGRRFDARVSPLPFALLPFAGFAVQEHLERLVHTGQFPVDAVASRTFVVGFALQAPFALLTFVLARLLLGAARKLGALLAGVAPRGPLAPASAAPCCRPAETSRVSVLALRLAGRAPPTPLVCA